MNKVGWGESKVFNFGKVIEGILIQGELTKFSLGDCRDVLGVGAQVPVLGRIEDAESQLIGVFGIYDWHDLPSRIENPPVP